MPAVDYPTSPMVKKKMEKFEKAILILIIINIFTLLILVSGCAIIPNEPVYWPSFERPPDWVYTVPKIP